MDMRHTAVPCSATPGSTRHLLLVTDTHQNCRATLVSRIRAVAPGVTVYPVPADAAAITAYLRQDRRAILVLSCCDGSLRPLALLADVRGQAPRSRVVVLSDERGLSFEHCAGRLKPDAVVRSLTEIPLAVELMGTPPVLEMRRGGRPLTPRETEVVQYVAAGLRNAEIAEMIGIAEKTVKVNLTNIYSKLGIRGRVELTALAPQLLSPAVNPTVAGM